MQASNGGKEEGRTGRLLGRLHWLAASLYTHTHRNIDSPYLYCHATVTGNKVGPSCKKEGANAVKHDGNHVVGDSPVQQQAASVWLLHVHSQAQPLPYKADLNEHAAFMATNCDGCNIVCWFEGHGGCIREARGFTERGSMQNGGGRIQYLDGIQVNEGLPLAARQQ